MKTLEDAIALAALAHKGQVDKAGEAYICHPLRLMLTMTTEAERMVAVLHDAVEDTDVTLASLEAVGYQPEVVAAVAMLTHEPDVPYMDYVRCIAGNALARKVKMADLRDNINLSRISAPTAKDHARIEKYQAALKLLENSA